MEMNHHDFFVISLADQLNFLRSSYRDYVLRAMMGYAGHGQPPFTHWDYDGTDFMVALIKEISHMESSPESIGRLPQSTELLVKAGFDVKTATWLACEIFKSVVDVIAAYFPDAEFGPYENGWDFGFVNGCDLGVTRPALRPATPPEPIAYEPPTAVPGYSSRRPLVSISEMLEPELPIQKTSAQIEAMQGYK
jgi:hypothetical protein